MPGYGLVYYTPKLRSDQYWTVFFPALTVHGLLGSIEREGGKGLMDFYITYITAAGIHEGRGIYTTHYYYVRSRQVV